MRNTEIADALDELADLYELDGAIVHRVVAYRSAARAVRDAGVSVGDLQRTGRAEELAGVGRTIAEKVGALLATGAIPAAEKLRAKFPAGLLQVTRVPGLGPKRARALYEQLGVASLDDLRLAAQTERLRTVPGFGPKSEVNVLAGLAAAAAQTDRGTARVLLPRALAIGDALVAALREHHAADRVELAGSARRLADTCKDLDIVVAATDAGALTEAFAGLEEIAECSSASTSGARGVTHNGMKVDLRVVHPENYGNLLQHFTGSKAHNEALRAEAVRAGLHVSEHGIVDDREGATHLCATEEEVYRLLGMHYVEPELREGRGELAAAREGGLPRLLRTDDLRGDLHSHTVASDGRNTIEEMATAALEAGHEYLAITDHSATHGFGDAVSPDELRRQIERVREVDARVDGVVLLAGSEVNVLPNGELDYDDALLAELDWVVASLHSSFRMPEDEMTDRMIAAIEHPLVDAIGHPTGRLIGRREPYALDLGRVFEAAARTGTFLEINANPDRRDLSDTDARAAAEAGVTLVIDSDAHGTETLANLRYGVATARRAWLTPEHVANARPWQELDALRKRRGARRAS